MMKIKIIVMILLVLPTYIFSQNNFLGFSPRTVDARSIAMGKTGIVSATGSNAIFSNPAMIASFNKTKMQAGFRVIGGTVEDEWAEDYYYSYDLTFPPHFSINHISFSMPYKLSGSVAKLALGMGYRTYFDWGYNLEEESTDDDYYSGSGDQTTTEISSNGGLNVITPTIAISLQNNLFLGITLNRSIGGKIETESTTTGEYGDVVKYEEEIEHSASFWKFSGLLKANQYLTLGFSYTPEFEWEIEEVDWTESYDGYNESGTDSEDMTYDIPALLVLGGSFQLSPKLLLVGEYQSRNFSDLKSSEYGLTGLDDGACYRFGLESRGYPLSLRMGYFSDAVMATDSGDDDPVSLSGFTGGFGYDIGSMYLDVYAEYSSITTDGYGGDDTAVILYELGLSVNYKF